MRIRRSAAVVSAALLLAACSQEVQGVASPESSAAPPSTTSPAPSSPSDPDPGPGTAGADTADKSGPATPGGGAGQGGGSQVAGINFSSDEASAELTINLAGSGVPEWTVGYSEATGPDGSPVDMAGDAFLRVRVRSEAGGGQGSSRFSISPGPVAEARTIGAGGGYEEVLIGVRGGEQPFSVEVLTEPGRLVIDVRTG